MRNKLIALLISSVSFSSFATIELTDKLSLSGFGSTSITSSDNKTPLIINRSVSDDTCLDCDTTFGVQLDFFNDNFKASAQLVKRPQDEWDSPELEWAYLGYDLGEVEFRAGRLRIPIFLSSEYYYVSHAYTYARPPEEVYNSILGLTAYNGANIVWNLELFDEYQLAITPFIGFSDSNDVGVSDTLDIDIDIDKMSGINFLLSGENYRVNFAYFNADFGQKFKFTNSRPGVPYFEMNIPDDNVELYSFGVEYELDSLLLTSERQIGNIRSTWYASAAYRIDKFVPYIQYGENKAKVTKVSRFDGKSGKSIALGVRYDWLYNVSINAEWQNFKSLAGQRGSFVERPLEPEADVYTLMFNFVF